MQKTTREIGRIPIAQVDAAPAGRGRSDALRAQARGMDYAAGQALLAPVQMHGDGGGAAPADVGRIAQSGTRGSGGRTAHHDTIQQAFGRHDVSGVASHVGGAAAGACGQLNASAYAQGTNVAFASAPDLHTAAHEYAHVVQQRGGVQLKGGVGQAGDTYERHADAVADAVVAGRSAESLLDPYAGSGGGASATAPVQRKEIAVAGGVFKDDCGDGYKPYNVTGPKYDERGGQMSQLEFRPLKGVTNKSGNKAKEIALVQTTNSTVRQKDQVGDVEDQPESMLDARRTEAGSAIDQQIYLKPELKTEKFALQRGQLEPFVTAMKGKGKESKTNELIEAFEIRVASSAYKNIDQTKQNILNTKLDMILKAEKGDPSAEVAANVPKAKQVVNMSRKHVNLDPRYAEERRKSSDSMKKTESSGTRAQGTTGWNAVRSDGNVDWPGAAVLRDRPAHTVATGTELEGQEEFEVVAMADGDKFVGSIKWGWKIDGTVAQLLHPEIVKCSDGEASEDFYEAAKKWNEMSVKDLDGETELTPMQLPTRD